MLKCDCQKCLNFCSTYSDSLGANDHEPMREDPGLATFGCTILRELNGYVKLPMSLSERTLFTKGHQQNYPLELRGTVFKTKLTDLIKEMNEEIKNKRVMRP